MKNYKLVFMAIFLLFIFKSYNLHADATQVGSIPELETAMANVYSNVSETDITTGILYGTKTTFTEFFNYQGITKVGLMKLCLMGMD